LANYLGNNEVAVGFLALGNESAVNTNNSNPYAGNNSNGNTAVGYNALINTKTDSIGADATGNTAVGYNALVANTIGYSNVALGDSTLANYSNPISSVIIGSQAGQNAVMNNGPGPTTMTVSNLYPFILGYQAAQQAVKNNNSINDSNTSATLTASDFLAIGYQTAQQAVQNNNNNVGDANLTASDFLAIGYQAAQ